MGGTQGPFHPKTGIDTSDGALPRSDSRPCGARPTGTEPRSSASHELSEPAQGDRRDKEPRLPAGRHQRRSMKKKGGGVAAPNGLELCCPAARASHRPFSRITAGQAPCPFARQPGQHQRVVRRPTSRGSATMKWQRPKSGSSNSLTAEKPTFSYARIALLFSTEVARPTNSTDGFSASL